MQLQPITSMARFYNGQEKLPAGAIPLASEGISGLVCLTPSGRWILFRGRNIQALPDETQKSVMEIIISELGGTAAAAAERLSVSPRTVEAWRYRKAVLPAKAAYQIFEEISKLQAEENENATLHRIPGRKNQRHDL